MLGPPSVSVRERDTRTREKTEASAICFPGIHVWTILLYSRFALRLPAPTKETSGTYKSTAVSLAYSYYMNFVIGTKF